MMCTSFFASDSHARRSSGGVPAASSACSGAMIDSCRRRASFSSSAAGNACMRAIADRITGASSTKKGVFQRIASYIARPLLLRRRRLVRCHLVRIHVADDEAERVVEIDVEHEAEL